MWSFLLRQLRGPWCGRVKLWHCGIFARSAQETVRSHETLAPAFPTPPWTCLNTGLDGTNTRCYCLHSRRSSWRGIQPFTMLSRAAMGPLLQHQPQAELCASSSSPRLPGPAPSAPSLPFTAVCVFFPQLVFSVIHVSVHHISRLCVRRKERSPPTQQPCNGWTFPIRSELTACENNSLNY